MNPATSSKIVLFAAVGTFGIGWFNAAKNGNKLPSKKFIVGTGITFTVLSFLSDIQPDIAGAFAGAMLTTVAFNQGGGILKYMNDNGEVQTPTPASKKTPVRHLTVTTHNDVGQIPGLTSHGVGTVGAPYHH